MPYKLTCYMDAVVIKIHRFRCQSTEFKDTHPCVQKDIDDFVIFTVASVLPNEAKKLCLVFRRKSLPLFQVIVKDIRRMEVEGVLRKQIVINCHLKCRADNASDIMNGALSSSVLLLQLDEPQFGIEQLHLIYLLMSEWIIANDIQGSAISCFR